MSDSRRRSRVLDDPELLELFGEDSEALAIVDAIAETQRRGLARVRWLGSQKQRRRSRWVPRVAFGLVVVAVGVGIAGPAFGLFRSLIPFSSSPKAHGLIVRDFQKLNLLTPGTAPGVVAGKTRQVYTFQTSAGAYALYATPAEHGGFCWGVRGIGVTCVTRTSPRVEPFYTDIPRVGLHEPSLIAGASREPIARAQLTFENGTSIDLPLVAVSEPIGAAFFFYDVPSSHWVTGKRPSYVTVFAPNGTPVGTGRLLYQTAR